MVIALAELVLSLSSSGQTQPQINVGKNVQVSLLNSTTPHGEVVIAAHSSNPNRLMACSVSYRADRNRILSVVYISSDAGQTWTPTLEPDTYDGLDPDCTFGPDGKSYFIGRHTPHPYTRSNNKYYLGMWVSNDGGLHWTGPTLIPGMDREYITIDHSSSSKYLGRVYINAKGYVTNTDGKNGTDEIVLYISDDSGKTLLGSAKRAVLDRRLIYFNGNSVTLSDGTFVTLFSQLKTPLQEGVDPPHTGKLITELKALISFDGGESFSDEATISNQCLSLSIFNSVLPSMAVDSRSREFKDRIYVVWPDAGSGHTRILFAYSCDKGKTWTQPKAIDEDEGLDERWDGLGDFMPVIAVNPSGAVGVMWYDRRENPSNRDWYVRFTASLDGGDTFLPSVRVSEAPWSYEKNRPWEVIAFSDLGSDGAQNASPAPIQLGVHQFHYYFFPGDTAGLAADASGIFHPLWVDTRTGLPQAWTAPVSVIGVVTQNGDPELSGLDDVSGKLELDVLSTSFDPSTQNFAVRARLRNISRSILRPPFKVRVVGVDSQVGRITLINADNGRSDQGAVWQFTDGSSHRAFGSESITDDRLLIFHLTNPRFFLEGGEQSRIVNQLVNLRLRVLQATHPK